MLLSMRFFYFFVPEGKSASFLCCPDSARTDCLARMCSLCAHGSGYEDIFVIGILKGLSSFLFKHRRYLHFYFLTIQYKLDAKLDSNRYPII